MKKILSLSLLFLTSIIILTSCGNKKVTETKKITIAYQYGMAYAPVEIIKEKKLIEKYYEDVEIEWMVLNSGSAINDGFLSNTVDIAYMGAGPFGIGVSNGVPYKLYTALSSQPMGLNTTKPHLKDLKDFTDEDKIALVSYGSIQHMMLAMAAKNTFGDPHALDHLIINMSHPDGMQALLSGSVSAHLTTAPYFNMELEDSTISEIVSVREAFPKDATYIIGVASTKLHDENKEIYDALVKATDEAMDFINSNTDEVAEMLYEKEGLTKEKMISYLELEDVIYTSKPNKVIEIIEFMAEAEFIESAPDKISDIYFENVITE